jgi:aromatase
VSEDSVQEVEHSIEIAAEPEAVHRLLADAVAWPHLFPPNVHVEREDLGAGRERLHIWALAGDEVRAWTSQRRVRTEELRISFHQEVSTAPVASMSGTWQVQAGPDGGSRVVLTHAFRAVGDDPAGLEWIEQATDRNSRSELESLRKLAESLVEPDEVLFTFADSVIVQASPEPVYDFLYRADLWPQRLPHVARVDLAEPAEQQQVLEMDSLSTAGARHTTRSVRIGRPPCLLVYKQTATPPALAAHTGRWILEDGPRPGTTRAVSEHTVRLDPQEALRLPGVGSLAEARAAVRRALGANSLITLEHAREYAQGGEDSELIRPATL